MHVSLSISILKIKNYDELANYLELGLEKHVDKLDGF